MARAKNHDQRAATVGASRLSRCHHFARLERRGTKLQFTSVGGCSPYKDSPSVSASRSLTKDGWPVSRSFFARSGIPPLPTTKCRRMRRESEGKSSGIPYLAKNERDMGHPSLVAGAGARPENSRGINGAGLRVRRRARAVSGGPCDVVAWLKLRALEVRRLRVPAPRPVRECCQCCPAPPLAG